MKIYIINIQKDIFSLPLILFLTSADKYLTSCVKNDGSEPIMNKKFGVAKKKNNSILISCRISWWYRPEIIMNSYFWIGMAARGGKGPAGGCFLQPLCHFLLIWFTEWHKHWILYNITLNLTLTQGRAKRGQLFLFECWLCDYYYYYSDIYCCFILIFVITKTYMRLFDFPLLYWLWSVL